MSATNVKKTTKKSAAATAVSPAAPAVAAPAPAPVVVATPAPAPVVTAPAPVAAAPVEAVAAATEQVNITAEFTSLVEQVNTLRTTLSTVFSNMRKLEKQIPRELKKASKGGRRHRKAEGDAPKKDTVFTRPVPISDALCTFLGVSKGTQLSRSEVTTRVCAYAKNNKLMDKQVIKADAALRKLLALKESDELKILNLQRYLKPHYTKPAVATATA
jgi:chromatin remodeling complex protein RSC6